MDKREFYKELMSEYTFDKDKILANAKKGKMVGRKPLPIYIGMTAAAAAVIVTISGVSIAMNLPGSTGVVLNPNDGITLAELTPEERIQKALDELHQNENSSELRDVLVTFRTPLAPPQAQGVLAGQSNVFVKMLIMEDDTRISDRQQIEAAFNGGTARIGAAVVNCAGYLMTQIDSSEFVELVEVLSNEDLADLTALKPVTPPPVEEVPDNTSNSGVNNGVGGETPDGPVVNLNEDNPVANPDDITTSKPDTSEPAVDPVVPIEPVNPENPIIPTVKPVTLPEGVKLPDGKVERPSYITDDIGAEKAYFLTEDVFLVRTKNAIRLYKWNGEIETLVVEQAATNVKVCWISEKGSRLMVTSTENGVRNKMYIVDANNCTINDMKVDDIVGIGAISGAAYNESLDILAMNVMTEGSGDIYVANLSGYQAANATLVASGLSNGSGLLAAANGAVYFSNVNVSADTTSTTVYKYAGGTVTEAMKLDGGYAGITNSAFTHATVIGTGGVSIFDPATEKLIAVESDKTISFGVAAHSLACNGGYYTIHDGKLTSDNSIATIAKIDFTQSFSTRYAAIVSNGSVRIVPSTYTGRILSENVVFVQPVENASAEARAAVNSAVGVVNALVEGKLARSGIDTADKLSHTIGACFTAKAATELKSLCGIADGSLDYHSGSLMSVDITNTVLAMQDSETGILFVKVGTFDGKVAYATVSVKLVAENGVLKADCIIN